MANFIFCLVGRSGVGKTTVADALANCGYRVISSYTTRPPRYAGEGGHIFVSDEEFDKLENLCAYTFFNGYKYGVPASMVDESDIYVIDPDGVDYLREHYHNKPIIVIGLTAPEEELRKRMALRGDSDEAIGSRIQNDNIKFAKMNSVCDVVIDSIDFEQTLSDVKRTIEGYRSIA